MKCSGNWMWAAKLAGEGALLFDTCRAMCEVMRQLGIAVDGGKDSLSMAARVGHDTVKSPGRYKSFIVIVKLRRKQQIATGPLNCSHCIRLLTP